MGWPKGIETVHRRRTLTESLDYLPQKETVGSAEVLGGKDVKDGSLTPNNYFSFP